MVEPAPRDAGQEADARYQALLALHSYAPEYRAERAKLPRSYRERDIGADLGTVAAATRQEVPVSARLAVLYDLAKAGYPGREDNEAAYLELVASAVRIRVRRREDEAEAGGDVPTAQELLDEIRIAAEARQPLSTRARAQEMFVHHEVVFIGRDVCRIEQVRVDGIRAVWVYSEFETDAAFDDIATWLDPHHWPDLSRTFFQRVDQVGQLSLVSPTAPPPGDPHWEGVFLEEVQLFQRVDTLLRCNHWRDGAAAAATTYDLATSVDHQIDVDRGYLLVTPAGDQRRVQVLKIVSFTQDLWDLVALLVCPFWTEWIRGAVQNASGTTVSTPSQLPDAGTSPVGDAIADWVTFFGEAAQPYLDLCSDVSSRVRTGSYGSGDVVADGVRWWSQFAKDWARAWVNVSETVEHVAQEGLDAAFTPPGTPSERGRGAASSLAAPGPEGGTLVPVAQLAQGEVPTPTELVSIGRTDATIPPADVTVTVETGPGGRRVRLRTTNTSAPHGLYVGRLRNVAQEDLAAVQLYVARATRA